MRRFCDDAREGIYHRPLLCDASPWISSVQFRYPRCPRKCLRSRFSYDACVVILRCPSLRGFHLGRLACLTCHGFFCFQTWKNPRWVNNVVLFCRGHCVFPALCEHWRAFRCHRKIMSTVNQLVCPVWHGHLCVSHCSRAPHSAVGSPH